MATRRQKGTGSVWQDKTTKKWKGEIQIGYLPNGKKRVKRVTGDTAKAVKNKLKKIELEFQNGDILSKSDATITEIAKAITKEKLDFNQVKQVSYNTDIRTIGRIENTILGSKPIQKVTEKDIKDTLKSMTSYSNSVIDKTVQMIKRTYRYAVKKGIVKSNLMDEIAKVKSSKPTKKVSALTLEQQVKVIDALQQDNKPLYSTMLLLSLYTGMRIGEICALDYNDVNFETNEIYVRRTLTRDKNEKFVLGDTTKTYAGLRTIKITPVVKSVLKEYKLNHYEINPLHLFFSKNGNLVQPGNTYAYFKRIIVRYGISETDEGFNQHMLRHTYATRCIEAGMSAKVLQKKLGHKDIKVTLNTYADVFDKFEDNEDSKLERYLMKEGLIV